MSKIIDAEDILNDTRGFLKCMWMAAADLGEPEEVDAIQTVTSATSRKIEEAVALLEEYRNDMGVGPVPDVPDAKPIFPAARTKRPHK